MAAINFNPANNLDLFQTGFVEKSLPKVAQNQLASIPHELQTIPNWVLWKYVDGKKIPFDAKNLRSASSTNPQTWADYAQAVATYQAGGFAGVGIVLDGTARLAGVDIDKCVVDGTPDPEALNLLASMGAQYIEISPSGKGLRAFGYADNLTSGANGQIGGLHIELYTNGRYLTVTGDSLKTGALSELIGFADTAQKARVGKKAAREANKPIQANKVTTPQVQSCAVALVDRRIVAYAQSALSKAANDVASAPEGQRNESLNNNALSLFRLPAIDPETVWVTLQDAAIGNGLDRNEVLATLGSARVAAAAMPAREVPAPAKPANPANPANFSNSSNENGVLGDLLTPANFANFSANSANFSPWIELDPLPEDELPQSGAFPFHAMGKVLGDAAQAIARSIQAPDAMAAGAVLATASLVCQPLVNVVTPFNLRMPVSLFVITAGTSGDRKSAVDAVACYGIEELRKRQAREHLRAVSQYESEQAARGKGDPAPKLQCAQQITVSNATVEGIGRLLKGQSSVGVFSPDGGDMLEGHSMRGDKRASGVTFFLRAWNGESVDTMRAGIGLTAILGRRVAMHIMIQPVLLTNLLQDPLADGQGLLARCLIAAPQSLAGTRLFNYTQPNKMAAVLHYHAAIQRLLDTPPPIHPDSDGFELQPRELHLNDDATRLWIAFHDAVEIPQGRGKELEKARAWASKAAEHAMRLAGILTIVDNPNASDIGEDAMANGIELASFYLSEHLRLTGTGRAERITNELRVLWDWLQSLGTPLVEKKKVTQNSPYRIRSLKAAGINPLLTELERRGYIQSVDKQWRIRTDV